MKCPRVPLEFHSGDGYPLSSKRTSEGPRSSTTLSPFALRKFAWFTHFRVAKGDNYTYSQSSIRLSGILKQLGVDIEPAWPVHVHLHGALSCFCIRHT